MVGPLGHRLRKRGRDGPQLIRARQAGTLGELLANDNDLLCEMFDGVGQEPEDVNRSQRRIGSINQNPTRLDTLRTKQARA